jgi:hypothetical protein
MKSLDNAEVMSYYTNANDGTGENNMDTNTNPNIVPPNALQKKDQMVKNYIRSIAEIDAAIEPYREQRKELRKEFVENGWLSKDEIKYAMKAYALIKQQADFDEIERITVSKGSDLPEGCLVAVLSNMVNKITCDGNTYLTVPESAIIGYFAGI